MSLNKEFKTSDILANTFVSGMQEVTLEIVSLDLRNIETSVCDFIVCHGTSNIHTSAIADSVIKKY